MGTNEILNFHICLHWWKRLRVFKSTYQQNITNSSVYLDFSIWRYIYRIRYVKDKTGGCILDFWFSEFFSIIRFGVDAWLWPVSLTVLVLDVGAGSASDKLHGTLLLPAIGCRVQWSVTQQVCAVDVWRLFPAELQPTQRSTAVGFSGPKYAWVRFHSGFLTNTVIIFTPRVHVMQAAHLDACEHVAIKMRCCHWYFKEAENDCTIE